MPVHHEEDEYLEVLYHLWERHELDVSHVREHLGEAFRREVLDRLVEQGRLRMEGERIELSESGFQQAEKISRQHRLAKRLLADVLNMSPAKVDEVACEFEHMVAEEITDGICTLLGHPRACPDGEPIPEGPCCRASANSAEAAVVPLSEMPVGTLARIAYINSRGDVRQHRLAGLGVIPGAQVRLHQLKPAVVVALEHSRVAMEQAIAKDIFVWRSAQEE
jgi:DtxR family Mn-dependent transcriptional regulator